MPKAAADEGTRLKTITIDATDVHYRDLNCRVRDLIAEGYTELILNGVNGQRYIADGITENVTIIVNGVAGNDLGAFMDGPTVIVNDNAQDGVGNTMNSGKVVVKGHAGDVIGYGMRGGKVFVRGDVGYRVGIHMKSFKEQVPVMVSGGRAGDFFGEYMAGGIMVLLGLSPEDGPITGSYVGTGMHGGALYIRGSVAEHQLGREVRQFPLDEEDWCMLEELLAEFAGDTGIEPPDLSIGDFIKLQPYSHRPYGSMYCY